MVGVEKIGHNNSLVLTTLNHKNLPSASSCTFNSEIPSSSKKFKYFPDTLNSPFTLITSNLLLNNLNLTQQQGDNFSYNNKVESLPNLSDSGICLNTFRISQPQQNFIPIKCLTPNNKNNTSIKINKIPTTSLKTINNNTYEQQIADEILLMETSPDVLFRSKKSKKINEKKKKKNRRQNGKNRTNKLNIFYASELKQ